MTETEPFLTRDQLRQRLNEAGYPITAAYFNKVCLPSQGGGPVVATIWGRRPLYRLSDGLAWAAVRRSEPVRV